jgi:hypothetical protein
LSYAQQALSQQLQQERWNGHISKWSKKIHQSIR